MVSTVVRIDERKDTNEAHVVVGEGSGSRIGCQRAIYSTCVLERRDPRLSHQRNASLRSGTCPANLFGERVAEDRTTTRSATAGASRRRAQQKRPRSVKRGHYHRDRYRRCIDSMSSPFTLTIDWLAFTLPSGSAQDTMQILGGDWTKSDTGFRGYPASWITTSASRGVGKLGTRAPRAPLEVHVDLSAGIVVPWPAGKVRMVLQWILRQEGHLTRLDCALDDRNSCVPLSTESKQKGRESFLIARHDEMPALPRFASRDVLT
jgi:hypothetical protein